MDHRITHTCGHEQTHFIAGFASQQERKATWLRTTVCGACYRKQRQEENERDAAASQQAVAHLSLAPLNGSERQVRWATTIRAKRIALLRKDQPLDSVETGAALLGIADAKWWIDNRDATDAQLLASAGVAQAPG